MQAVVTHFNHSGAGLPAPETIQVITEHLQRETLLGPMEAGAAVAARLDAVRFAASRLLGCRPEEVAFGTGHGQLYGEIISSIPLVPDDKILMSRQEWIGNVLCLRLAAKSSGASWALLPADETTAVDVELARTSITPDVKIVALTWVGASGALVNPAAALGKAIRESGSSAFYIIDASQALGQIPVNVTEIGCDALVACGRKYLRGPRGTALAYISPRLADALQPRKVDNLAAVLDGDDIRLKRGARLVETAEHSVGLLLGLGSAIEIALELDVAQTHRVLNSIVSTLRDRLIVIPGVELFDLGRERAAFVTFRIAGVSCGEVRRLLAERGIAIGANGVDYTPFDMEIRGISEVLRASVHLSTTDEDIDKLVGSIREIAAQVNTDQRGIIG